jgi:hypothetical protein
MYAHETKRLTQRRMSTIWPSELRTVPVHWKLPHASLYFSSVYIYTHQHSVMLIRHHEDSTNLSSNDHMLRGRPCLFVVRAIGGYFNVVGTPVFMRIVDPALEKLMLDMDDGQ